MVCPIAPTCRNFGLGGEPSKDACYTDWQHGEGVWQLRVCVAAKYGSDPNAVRDAMLTTAAANPEVLRDPAPVVRLTTLSGGSLGFELRMFTPLGVDKHPDLLSALQFALMEELTRRGVALKE